MIDKILKLFLGNNENVVVQSGNIVNGCSGSITINGKEVHKLENGYSYKIILEGNANTIRTQGSIEINGNVNGDIDTQGPVRVTGNVGGNIDTQGSVTVGGSVTGKIDTMGSVRIGTK